MKQVIQSFRTGKLELMDVPPPVLRPRGIIVRTAASVISAGTERMVLEFAEKNLVQKAQARPDLVRQVVEKVRRDGLLATFESVKSRMDQPLALGYSSSGTVLEVGADAPGFRVGDRVACAGGGFASHAEVAFVPRNLAVVLPDNVSFEDGAFATIGAIALQGIRQADITLGSSVAVIGLGLIGQLTVQMLKAAGCRVMGIDLNPTRVAQARTAGADLAVANGDALSAAQQFTHGHGFDAVLITADTKSNEPIHLAGEISRDRGIVVAVGAVGMELPRKIYYEKDLQFRLGRSYGPGRYDNDYEEGGNDYPYGYVRWTEQRNLQAFVEMCSSGKVRLDSIITHRFDVADAMAAYDLVSGETKEPFTGIVLKYPCEKPVESTVRLAPPATAPSVGTVELGVIGAGVFASNTLLPAIKAVGGVQLQAITSGSGLSARTLAGKFGFNQCSSSANDVFADPKVNTVAILTRHNLHARQVIAALNAGKNVFVEKPLCLTQEELSEIVAAYQSAQASASVAEQPGPALMVGFNRRFAPFVVELKQRLNSLREPLMIQFRVNAGFIPPSHWTQDINQGGGRLAGEGCHFIDLVTFLSGSKPVSAETRALPDNGRYNSDNVVVTIEYENGAIATVTYVANGNKSFSKEFLEVFGGGLAARIDDYRTLEIVDDGGRIRKTAHLRTDKGHRAEWQAFAAHLQGKAPAPIPFDQLVTSTRATLAAVESLRVGARINIESD